MNDSLIGKVSETESVESESRVKHNIKVVGLRLLYTHEIKELIYQNFIQNLNLEDYLKDMRKEKTSDDLLNSFKNYETVPLDHSKDSDKPSSFSLDMSMAEPKRHMDLFMVLDVEKP